MVPAQDFAVVTPDRAAHYQELGLPPTQTAFEPTLA